MTIPGSDILALVTNQGKARIADMLATGKSYKIDIFRLGDGGYDLNDNTLPITPDPSAVDVYGTPGGVLTKPINMVSLASPTCPVVQCIALAGEGTGPIGSLGLLGTIVYSPIPGDPELGLKFLFALATMPIKVKVPLEVFTFNVGIIL